MSTTPKYGAIVVDPPWPQAMVGRFANPRHARADRLAYATMTLEEIERLEVRAYAARDASVWLWCTNSRLHDAFHMLQAWGFKYLTTITWCKPSGFGAYFASTTQHLLVGYTGKLRIRQLYYPTHFEYVPRHHSRKPDHSYRLIERVADGPYLELFARERRLGWDSIGNEIDGRDIRSA